MVVGVSLQYGYDAQMGYAVQTSLTARESVTNATIQFNSESLDTTIEPLIMPTVRPTIRGKYRREQGNKTIAGTIEYPVNPVDGWIFFKYLLGGCTSTVIGATDAYTHTFYPTVTLPSDTATALTICVKRGAQYFDFTGCKVNQITLRAEAGTPLMASVDIIGYDSTVGASTAMTASYSPLIPFMMAGSSFTAKYGDSMANLSTTVVTRLEMSINNNVPTDSTGRALGNDKMNIIQGDMRDVDITLEHRFDTITMYNDFIASTPKAWQFTIVSPNTAGTGGTNCALIINIPKAYYENAPINISGDGPILVSYTMKGFYDDDSTTGYDVQMQLTNTLTAII